MDSLLSAIRARPLSALAVSNSLLAAALLWSVSEGKPLKWVYKKLFQAVVAAVPSSIIAAEEAKMRVKIEQSVIGHSLDGEVNYAELPAAGESSSEPASVSRCRSPSGLAPHSLLSLLFLAPLQASQVTPSWRCCSATPSRTSQSGRMGW